MSCSNSIRKTMDLMFERAAIKSYFEFYLSNEDVRKPKPNPEMYLEAIRRLKLSPDECLILEDNENGIRAAKASGAHLLVVSNAQDVNFEIINTRIQEIERTS